MQSITANYFELGTTVSHAESRLNGVRIVGGLLTIDSITSISDVHYNADGEAKGTSSTIVQGAKMLGQPVTIGTDGVHADNSPVDPALLQQAGLSVRLVGATNGPDGSFMTAQSEGVVIEYTHDVTNAPSLPSPPPNPITQTSPSLNGTYFVHYNLATVSSRALARNLTFTGSVTGSSGSLGSSGATLSSLNPGVAAPSGFTGSQSTAPASALNPPGDTTGSNASFLGLDFDLRWLYLAAMLAAFAMCLAPRLILPARLPAPKG